MTEAERVARGIVAGQLLSGESLAACLGGLVRTMNLCGSEEEKRVAAILDAVVMSEWVTRQ